MKRYMIHPPGCIDERPDGMMVFYEEAMERTRSLLQDLSRADIQICEKQIALQDLELATKHIIRERDAMVALLKKENLALRERLLVYEEKKPQPDEIIRACAEPIPGGVKDWLNKILMRG